MRYSETIFDSTHDLSRIKRAIHSSNEINLVNNGENSVGRLRALPRNAEIHAYSPRENQLLAALPDADFERLFPDLSLVSMRSGATLSEFGRPIKYVYFPINSILSLLHESEDGSSSEIAIIGKDGLAGVAACMGGESRLTRVVVNSAGFGFRLPKYRLIEEFGRGGALQQLLLRYTQALMAQMSQMAVCNRHHSVPQQFCRRLLLSLDRLPANELNMTQETMANMLGVRRESVVAAASKLQHDGMIQYSRGHITVIDRLRIEAQVCECYACVKTEYDRLLTNSVHSTH
jgi:CRP-like cAMP-binding protein